MLLACIFVLELIGCVIVVFRSCIYTLRLFLLLGVKWQPRLAYGSPANVFQVIEVV